MQKSLSKIVMASMLAASVAACSPEIKLSDPTIEYPVPPATLMEPAKTPKTIPTTEI